MTKTARHMLVDPLTKSDNDVIPFHNRKQAKSSQTNQRAPPLDTMMHLLGGKTTMILK